MSGYKHVLFATDLSERALRVGERAKEITQCYGARLSLIHVIEETSINAGYELVPLLPELPDDAMLREANDNLDKLANNLGLPDAERWAVMATSTKEGILRAAREHHVDLIVVGSRGRHGLALLLGSTANAVLHGAPCDVLAVLIKD